MIQRPDPQDSAEYEAWIRQSIRQAKINQFDKHVEILEEQYIDKETDVPVMLQRKVPTAQTCSPRTVEMHQVQSIDTVDNISVNRQRQVPRTGTAQWQDLGDVSCDATQVPMIQKMQKTVEILQVQFIDKVVELKSLRTCRAKTSAKDQQVRKLAEVHSQNCGRSSRSKETEPAKCSSP